MEVVDDRVKLWKLYLYRSFMQHSECFHESKIALASAHYSLAGAPSHQVTPLLARTHLAVQCALCTSAGGSFCLALRAVLSLLSLACQLIYHLALLLDSSFSFSSL